MAHERRAHILRLLAEQGSVRSAELALELGVTDETIRTDLVRLEREGQLRRCHGGAEFLPPSASFSSASRLDYQFTQVLLPLIPPGACLMVDASRLAQALLSQLPPTPLVLLSHAPELLRAFAAPALPHRLLSAAGEWDRRCQRLCPLPDVPLPLSPTLAILSPERVELRGSEVAIAYEHEADRRWAELALAHAPQLLLAFPASAIAPWSGKALPCSPALVLTEDNVPPEATPPHLRVLPYLEPASLMQADAFDY